MNFLKSFVVGMVLLTLSILQIPAQVLFSDGFESYAGGGVPLDKNYAGANSAPNGSGNPWWGPAPPNARVITGTEGSVSPHGGNQMIRGSAPSDGDINRVNLAYRFNSGSAFAGNIALDFWFYDTAGAGTPGNNLKDVGALSYYSNVPGNTDYINNGSLAGYNAATLQLICLGAASNESAGYDNTKYQARIVGATDGYNNGWFNLGITRSIGWHEGEIVIGAAKGNGHNDISFYLDNMSTPLLTHDSMQGNGYNVIELYTDTGSTSAYFDNVTLSQVPEPSAAALLLCGGLTWLALRRRK